jgi:hypothetical protein
MVRSKLASLPTWATEYPSSPQPVGAATIGIDVANDITQSGFASQTGSKALTQGLAAGTGSPPD